MTSDERFEKWLREEGRAFDYANADELARAAWNEAWHERDMLIGSLREQVRVLLEALEKISKAYSANTLTLANQIAEQRVAHAASRAALEMCKEKGETE